MNKLLLTCLIGTAFMFCIDSYATGLNDGVEYCPPPKLGYQFTGATFYSPYDEVSCFYDNQATGRYPYANHIYAIYKPIWPSAPDECFSNDVMQCPFET